MSIIQTSQGDPMIGDADVFETTPLLHYISSDPELSKLQPLASMHVICTLHVLDNIKPTLRALECFGLDPQLTHVFYKCYKYPCKSETLDWLMANGYRCKPVESLHEVATLQSIENEIAASESQELLLLEDGGHAFSAICAHGAFLLPRVLGMVEQTTKGITRIIDAIDRIGQELQIPVVSLPHASMKQTLEPPHIARAVVKSIDTLMGHDLNGRRVAVLGCGTIGSAIIKELLAWGCKVTAYDHAKSKALRSEPGVDVCDSAVSAVRDARVVIGTSGQQSIDTRVIDRLPNNCYVVSTGSDCTEIDHSYIERTAKAKAPIIYKVDGSEVGTTYLLRHSTNTIHLLADGMPINFLGFGQMSDSIAQAVLAMLVVGTANLASGRYAGQKGILDTAFDELDDEYKISATVENWRD